MFHLVSVTSMTAVRRRVKAAASCRSGFWGAYLILNITRKMNERF
jgi:hypothetical protein